MANPEFFVPHQYQPDRIIKAGDVLVTEISTTFWGYTGQILRTLCIEGEPAPLYQEMYEVAENTYSSIVSIMRTGATIGEVLDQAESFTKRASTSGTISCTATGAAVIWRPLSA